MSNKERLEAAVKELQSFGDAIDAKDGGMTAEDQQGLTARMQEVAAAKKALESDAEAKGALADAKAFMASLGGGEPAPEQRESLTLSGLPMDTHGKTFGELFVGSEGYKDFVGRYSQNGVIPNATKGIQSNPFSLEAKSLVTGLSSTSGGAYVVNDRYGAVTDLVGERELSLRDVVTVGSTTSDTIDYVRVTSKTNNAATVAEATSSASPTTGASSGAALTLNAGGGYKPESGLATEVVSTTVKTIAHWIPMTKRAAADAPQVRTLVDNFLRYGLNEALDSQILTGNGSGENLTGILNTSGIQTVGSAGTDIDAIVDAIAAVRVTGRRRPNALVINPNDWYSTGFLTAKDSQNKYLVGDPRASIDQLNQLWGLKVVVTEAQTQNTALVGDFTQAVLWEREGINLMVSDQHADFFIRNLLAILAEMRAAFGVLDPEAFCTVTAV